MNIGEKIKELRTQAGVSQKQLAEKIGTSQPLVSWWEKGKYEPTLFFRTALADFFGVTLDELCGR